MIKKPENLYFRIKDNGAAVFRVDAKNRQNRLELRHIASINVNTRKIKLQNDVELSKSEEASIEKWMDKRQKLLSARQADNHTQAIEQLSLTAQWLQSKASDAEFEDVADDLLMAMHDLRSVIVRRKSNAITKKKSK